MLRLKKVRPNKCIIATGLALFFCLSFSFAFAAAPTVGTITPSSGSTTPDIAKTFTCTYSDTDGWANLKEAYFLVNTTASTFTNSIYLYYDQNNNLLYLRNDTNTTWLGGFVPGSTNTIENSQVKLNCSLTTVSGISNTLTVNYNITFKASYSGKAYNTYLYIKDDTGGKAGWSRKGTYTLNNPPQVGAITPSSGTGNTETLQNFTTTFSDPDGWQNIRYVYLIVNTSASGSNCFYGYYNRNENKLYMRNDANNAWLGGSAPGTSAIIENTFAKLDCAATTVTGNGPDLAVNWAITFKKPFTGSKNTYLYVKDNANNSAGYTKKGTWTLPNTTPQVGLVTPSSGTSIPDYAFNFITTFSDPDGWKNIQYVYFLINASIDGKNCFYGYYNRNGNKLYLRNDTSSAWLGGYIPGASNRIENSYAKLDCAQTTVTSNSNTLTVKWNIIFKPAFTGAKKLYLYIKDNANAYQNWAQKGTWTALANGKVITPDGGEVISSDGKVKLIIPANALNEPTIISISSVNKETLQNTAPSGTSLLSAVDCQPYGLVFNKPVQIIYKLDTPEIPGTPVVLGLYDSAQNKIVSTEQVSTIPADGYNVSFSLLHFSTYAALKNMTPQQAPIGAGVKVPLPDMLTGAFGHTIAINIPPGRKGIQPSLGLTYRSGNSNSWAGLGFSLNPGYIVRSTRLGPPTYIDTQDTFYFITDAGTTELVCLIDNLYQAKVESSFTKFFKEADGSWRAIGKDGSTLRFGQSESAREVSPQGTFSWYITKAVDTNGNYLEYQYIKDQGKVYLSRIDYTGNESVGVSPKNSVEFFLESRNDIASSYISGAKIATAKRLKEIQAKVDGELVWRYVLEYVYSEDTNRSLLKSITQYASDDKTLPAQRFSYQKSK